jgi:cytochrome bd-type quinol oxidase subunit 1
MATGKKEQPSSADKRVELLFSDKETLQILANSKNPQKVLKGLRNLVKEAKLQPQIPSTMVYKLMVGFLGLLASTAVVGAIILVATDKEVPEILIAIGSAAVGALAGALVPTAKGQ